MSKHLVTREALETMREFPNIRELRSTRNVKLLDSLTRDVELLTEENFAQTQNCNMSSTQKGLT